MVQVIPAADVNPADHAETIPAWAAVGASTVQNANNVVIHRMPRLTVPLLVAKVRLWVALTDAAPGHLDVGVYTFDGTTWTLRDSSGSTNVGGTGAIQTVTMLSPFTVPVGADWYLGLAGDAVVATFQRTAAGIAGIFAAGPTGVAMAFRPSSFPLATNATSFVAASLTLTNTFSFWMRASAA